MSDQMKVYMLACYSGGEQTIEPGTIAEFDLEHAHFLINAGAARELTIEEVGAQASAPAKPIDTDAK